MPESPGESRMRMMMILVAATALSACDKGGEERNTRSIRVIGTSDFEARLKSLSDLDRGLGLRRAIMDSGARCKSVDASGYQQAHGNMSMWTVRCSDRGEFALFIAPNADVQVRRCADAAQLKLPACRFEAEAAAAPAR